MNQTTINKDLLHQVDTKINQDHISEALKTLYEGLSYIRKHYSTEDWKQFITEYREHWISNFFLQEPLARRAFDKPRGYAGDPIMLDLQYDFEKMDPPANGDKQPEVSELLYYEFNHISHANHANRERKRILARKIDETSERIASPYILSIACGHLREVLDSVAIKNKSIGKFIAIDQDEESLSVAAERIEGFGETIQASVVDIMRNKVPLPGFDFIYSLGVYDYLPDRLAKKLTNKLFQLLNPGGRLLIINYLPNNPTIAYMEAVMDWWLIYRDKKQMQDLLEEIPQASINNVDIFVEQNEVIIFMEIEKVKGDEKNEEK